MWSEVGELVQVTTSLAPMLGGTRSGVVSECNTLLNKQDFARMRHAVLASGATLDLMES